MTAPSPQAAAVLARLRVIALALMGSQVFYIVVGWLISQSPGRALFPASPAVQAGVVVLGACLLTSSFVVIRQIAIPVLAAAPKAFFLAFAVAEAAAMLGLVASFLTKSAAPLFVLAVLTAGVIDLHYRYVARRVTGL